MASAVSQLNSFHSASQTQLRVLNTSVRSKQDMHSGRHMQSPTMMRSAVTARREIGERSASSAAFFREQLKQGWRKTEQSLRTSLDRNTSASRSLERIESPNREGTLPLGGLATSTESQDPSTIAHLERCMQESADTKNNGLSLPSPGHLASRLLEATIKLAGTSEIDARRSLKKSISTALHQQALKKGIDPESILSFENRQHFRHIERALLELAENATTPSEIETASAPTKAPQQIDLSTELTRVEPKAMTKAELIKAGREFQASIQALENLPIGSTTAVPSGAEVLYVDISGSSAGSEKYLPQDHELQSSYLGLAYEEKAGARVSSGLALELVSHCAEALSEAYGIPADFFVQKMSAPGDGFEVCLPPGSTQILAPILHAFKQKVEGLGLGLSSKNIAFHISPSESPSIQLEMASSGLKLSLPKMVDEAIKRQSNLFSMNFDGTPADLSLHQANTKQKMIPLKEGTLAIGLVFTTQDAKGIELLEKALSKYGITEASVERHMKELLPESHHVVQSAFNLPDGNVGGFLDHRMFPQLKAELIKLEAHGVKVGMTVSNKMYVATLLSAKGEPQKEIILTDVLTKGSINLKEGYYWEALKKALPELKQIAENLGITQLDEQVKWIQKNLDAFTPRAKMFNPQSLLQSVREGLEPAAQKEYKNAIVSFSRGGLASLVPA